MPTVREGEPHQGDLQCAPPAPAAPLSATTPPDARPVAYVAGRPTRRWTAPNFAPTHPWPARAWTSSRPWHRPVGMDPLPPLNLQRRTYTPRHPPSAPPSLPCPPRPSPPRQPRLSSMRQHRRLRFRLRRELVSHLEEQLFLLGEQEFLRRWFCRYLHVHNPPGPVEPSMSSTDKVLTLHASWETSEPALTRTTARPTPGSTSPTTRVLHFLRHRKFGRLVCKPCTLGALARRSRPAC
ncbi:hypothetical protein HPB47_019904 [Ixodes persulcatus]|uniref:Uncharacterized protein n=1 Tax=Ixodes persulcatus TaxID=34615 RepID=A0AC60QKE0_IXOPE|nr:hypothetical protein HPB47_019904 [Ixodes persulcatus]